MAEKGAFLFRTNPKILDALKRWADDDFRSINGQLEYILRQALREAGRLAGQKGDAGEEAESGRETRQDPQRNARNKSASGK